ncbi:MAG: multidrug ABC transporter substrate-binding protein, partial [bacterium]|nr:multidrug ABC transporter substrate-binding protein [bacterium]
ALAALTGIVFGLVPAIQASSARVAPALKDSSAGGGEAGRYARFRKAAVVTQVAMSLLLLVAAGLFARSLYNLHHLDPGFRVDRLLAFSLDPELSGYTRSTANGFYRDLHQRLGSLPGVETTAAASIPVLAHHTRSGSVSVEGYRPEEGKRTGSSLNFVSRDYFRTLGIPLVLGREFNERDETGAAKIAVVNERFVREYISDRNPLGCRIALSTGNPTLDIEIVGVVRDQQSADLREERNKFVYLPYSQINELPALTFYIRT